MTLTDETGAVENKHLDNRCGRCTANERWRGWSFFQRVVMPAPDNGLLLTGSRGDEVGHKGAQEAHQSEKGSIGYRLNVDVASGLFAGVFCAGLFNPWDRALYLSIKYNRKFLLVDNFQSPYQGFMQSIVQRAIVGGAYYSIQGQLKRYVYPYLCTDLGLSESIGQFSIGFIAGSMSGLVTHALTATKYHIWGKQNPDNFFFGSMREMYAKGGVSSFTKGTKATIARDIVFGSSYEVLRYFMREGFLRYASNKEAMEKNKSLDLMCNATAAALSTAISSPLHYARNIQFGSEAGDSPPSVRSTLMDVWKQAGPHQDKSLGRLRFFQEKFKVGWGTARVALGMAVGQGLFDSCRARFS